MRKSIALTIFATAILFTSHAQNTNFGVTAGAAFANYHAKSDGEKDNGSSKTGLTVGLFVDVPVSTHFSFQPAVNFVQKGTKDEQTDGGITAKLKMTVNCLEVPLNFIYNAHGSSGNFFIGAGPSLAFSMSGKLKYKDDQGNAVSETLNFGSSEDDAMKGFDLGANFVAGYQFKAGILIAANINAGLSNLAVDKTNGDKLHSQYVGIRLGYMFNKKSQK
jgi:hypothetical protein